MQFQWNEDDTLGTQADGTEILFNSDLGEFTACFVNELMKYNGGCDNPWLKWQYP